MTASWFRKTAQCEKHRQECCNTLLLNPDYLVDSMGPVALRKSRAERWGRSHEQELEKTAMIKNDEVDKEETMKVLEGEQVKLTDWEPVKTLEKRLKVVEELQVDQEEVQDQGKIAVVDVVLRDEEELKRVEKVGMTWCTNVEQKIPKDQFLIYLISLPLSLPLPLQQG